METKSERRPYIWLLAVIALLALAALPMAWLGPFAPSVRATVPVVPGDEIIIRDEVVDPSQPVTKTVTIRNLGTTPKVNCVLRFAEVKGLEYLVNGVVVSPPYEFPLGTLQPGQQVEFVIVIRLTEDAQPCMEYVIEIQFQCEGQASVLRYNPIVAPCPVLPEVGD